MARLKLVDGLDITTEKVDGRCEDCIMGKQTRRAFDEIVEHESELCERIHIDIWGASRTQSKGGNRYMMLLTDGFSSYRVPYFLNDHKAPTTLAAFQHFHVIAERQTGKKIKWVRVDQEFTISAWETYCDLHGIIIESGPPYSSSQNGMAERGNQIIIEGVRATIYDSSLPPSLWSEIGSSQMYLRNFIPSSRHPDKVPMQTWTGKRQDVSHLRPLGCWAWAKIPEEKGTSKLSPRSICRKLMGYQGRRGYRLYIPESQTILLSRDVIFEEEGGHWTLPRPVEPKILPELFGENDKTTPARFIPKESIDPDADEDSDDKEDDLFDPPEPKDHGLLHAHPVDDYPNQDEPNFPPPPVPEADPEAGPEQAPEIKPPHDLARPASPTLALRRIARRTVESKAKIASKESEQRVATASQEKG